MAQDYRIESLGHVFGKHADEFDKQYAENLEKYPDMNYPNMDFNLARALSVICCEIERLKHKTGCI